MNNKPARTFFLLVIVIISGIALMNFLSNPSSLLGGSQPKELTTAQLYAAIQTPGRITSAQWQQGTFKGEFNDNTKLLPMFRS
ncbi:MAG: hypothetical protein ACHQ50_08850 [Fimbriimonadales bacterium]